jgi:hypothetical protein
LGHLNSDALSGHAAVIVAVEVRDPELLGRALASRPT